MVKNTYNVFLSLIKLNFGCDIKIVSEEYTSKCCTKCGYLSNKYSNRMKQCPYCNLVINRDINGSRNILIKNHQGCYK